MQLRKIKPLLYLVVMVTSILIPGRALACSADGSQMIGGMCVFAGNFAPRGYALAQGQLLAISQNTALFSILGTTYGGDGRTTFALPDLRGRAAIGQGTGPGLPNYRLGAKGGRETVTLSIANMPSHNHSASTTVTTTINTTGSSAVLRALAAGATTNSPTNNVLANSPNRENIYASGAPDVDMSTAAVDLTLNLNASSSATTNIGNQGGSQSFSVRNPYLAINWIIALTGIFPSRS